MNLQARARTHEDDENLEGQGLKVKSLGFRVEGVWFWVYRLGVLRTLGALGFPRMSRLYLPNQGLYNVSPAILTVPDVLHMRHLRHCVVVPVADCPGGLDLGAALGGA